MRAQHACVCVRHGGGRENHRIIKHAHAASTDTASIQTDDARAALTTSRSGAGTPPPATALPAAGAGMQHAGLRGMPPPQLTVFEGKDDESLPTQGGAGASIATSLAAVVATHPAVALGAISTASCAL